MKTEKWVVSEDGTEISYSITGRGSPMLLCDGIGCDQYAWKYLIPYFSNRFQIINWNYRGHGRTPAPKDSGHVRMADTRKDLEAIINKEKLSDVVLVGHSMGAQVILDYYLNHPDQIAALVPICGSYGRPLATFHDSNVAERVLPYLRRIVERFPAPTKAIWSRMVGLDLIYQIAVRTEANGDFIQREDFAIYFEHLKQVDPLLFVRMLSDLSAHDLEPRLHEVHAPTLIVAGERDTFTPAWISRKMHDKIRESEFLFVAGGTHTTPIEFPELLNLRLEKFFNERLPAATVRIASANG